MTLTLLLRYNALTMNGIATISDKGQVVIPQAIRELLGLEPLDKIYFETKNNQIIARPLLSINEALGVVKSTKFLPKAGQKAIIKQKVRQKFSLKK